VGEKVWLIGGVSFGSYLTESGPSY